MFSALLGMFSALLGMFSALLGMFSAFFRDATGCGLFAMVAQPRPTGRVVQPDFMFAHADVQPQRRAVPTQDAIDLGQGNGVVLTA